MFNTALNVSFSDFLPVKACSLFPGSVLPCDFYFASVFEGEEEIRPDKILARGELYSDQTSAASWDREDLIYIRQEDEPAYFAYLCQNTREAAKSRKLPTERKTELLYNCAEGVVRKVFHEHPNLSNMAAGGQIARDLAQHLAAENIAYAALLDVFSKDYSIFTHCVQVATLGMTFGNFLGWSASEISDFGFGVLFHDLGKTGISRDILDKPGKLDDHEFELLKQHPFLGYRQLSKTRAFSKDQLDAILYHHEAMDGSGYPEGLSGDDIPFTARVAHIVDIFDALTTRRVYKEALSPEDALALMGGEMQASCDQGLFTSFLRFIEGREVSGPDRYDLDAGIGTVMSIQFKASDKRDRALLVGMEVGQYIILRLSNFTLLKSLYKDMPLVLRYIFAGHAYGFTARIIRLVHGPFPLILIAYPDQVEKVGLRSELRHECVLPAQINMRGRTCRCILVDLSYKGCRVCIKHGESGNFAPLYKDEPVEVGAELPGAGSTLRLKGRIRNRVQEERGEFIGIEFVESSMQAEDQWKAFVDHFLELTR